VLFEKKFWTKQKTIPFASTCDHSQLLFSIGVVCVAFLCCPIMCHYAHSSVLWCPLHREKVKKNNVALLEQLVRQQLRSVQKIPVRGTSSTITYELWNVNYIHWWCWYIWVTRWVSYKRQELLTVGGHPVCCWGAWYSSV
jgi:hypothetical protein